MKYIPIGKLAENEGQIEGLPANPRSWTDEDVDSLAQSLLETPELFEARPIIAVKHGKEYIVLGGNMRTLAAENAGMSKVPVAVMPEDTPIDKMKEIVIKDNSSFGMWDTKELNDKWRDLPLGEWGVLLPEWTNEPIDEDALDELFVDAGESGDKGERITITVPTEYEDKLEDIKASIKVTLEEWPGCKV